MTKKIEWDINHNQTLVSFLEFCRKNPKLRFWQALRTWSKSDKLIRQWYDKEGHFQSEDTYYKD